MLCALWTAPSTCLSDTHGWDQPLAAHRLDRPHAVPSRCLMTQGQLPKRVSEAWSGVWLQQRTFVSSSAGADIEALTEGAVSAPPAVRAAARGAMQRV